MKQGFLISALFVLSLVFSGCTKGTEENKTTFKVFSETYENTIEISGNINAAEQQKMTAASAGTIEKVYFKEGDFVKKGDIICKMDDLEQQYNIANLKYQIAQKKLSASPREIELLELQLKVKQNELNNKKCIARFDGIIAKLAVKEGDYLEAQNEIATIINRNYLKASVEVAEIDASKLALNQKVTFTFPAYPKPLTGYVSYFPAVGTITSRGSTVVEAEVRIDNPPDEILTGYSFTGTIQITEPQVLVLTDRNVLYFENKVPYVNKINSDGREEKIQIEYEPYGRNYIRILSGVAEGDLLVNAAGSLKSGQKKDSSASDSNSNVQRGQSNSSSNNSSSKSSVPGMMGFPGEPPRP